MSLGVIMLVHTALDRAEQVARHWAAAGCPVVMHVDRKVPRAEHARLRARLADLHEVRFCRRRRVEWGTWGLVAASLDASAMLLEDPQVEHVLLSSGACLPLRPVAELRAYLATHRGTDFIESATVEDVPWTVDGLSEERFTLFFPLAWRRHRVLFDALVEIQRRLGIRRSPPRGLVPHIGSQWWCLSRATLSCILTHPDRSSFDRYFRRTWIPDEGYFQSLVRRFSTRIESRSLTLSKFDFQGKPHIFYDDHLPLLRRSDCFVARKIWPHADRLYEVFLGEQPVNLDRPAPRPGKIDRLFAKAVDRRTRGRPGLYMQSRFPNRGWENGVTATRYAMLHGYDALFDGFGAWLEAATGLTMHGRLFAPEGAAFAGGGTTGPGALPASPVARDANPRAFLTNLVWNARGAAQGFLFAPGDTPELVHVVADDPNAQVFVATGTWVVALAAAGLPFEVARARAAALQRAEAEMLGALRSPGAKARISIRSMADIVEDPAEALRGLAEAIGARNPDALPAPPPLRDLTAFAAFRQRLENAGMHPYLTGDVVLDRGAGARPAPGRLVAE